MAKILIVDDDKSILSSISLILEINGYSVDTADTAGEALEKLRNQHYDLALIDVILPDMKGTDLLTKAKQELKQTIKFIITGYPSGEIGAKAREGGADAFILKPVKMSELLSVIHVFLDELEQNTPYVTEEEKSTALSDINSDLSS